MSLKPPRTASTSQDQKPPRGIHVRDGFDSDAVAGNVDIVHFFTAFRVVLNADSIETMLFRGHPMVLAGFTRTNTVSAALTSLRWADRFVLGSGEANSIPEAS